MCFFFVSFHFYYTHLNEKLNPLLNFCVMTLCTLHYTSHVCVCLLLIFHSYYRLLIGLLLYRDLLLEQRLNTVKSRLRLTIPTNEYCVSLQKNTHIPHRATQWVRTSGDDLFECCKCRYFLYGDTVYVYGNVGITEIFHLFVFFHWLCQHLVHCTVVRVCMSLYIWENAFSSQLFMTLLLCIIEDFVKNLCYRSLVAVDL